MKIFVKIRLDREFVIYSLRSIDLLREKMTP